MATAKLAPTAVNTIEVRMPRFSSSRAACRRNAASFVVRNIQTVVTTKIAAPTTHPTSGAA